MTLRKVLLYGGCHALVLRDLLTTYFGDRVAATLLVNFELIRKGAPFPYEELRGYDIVVYSPIENKGEYNTDHLVEACRATGVEAICFPWLEWHGYCPGATKGEFKNRFQWRYPALIEAASAFASFEAFVDWAIEAFPDDATIEAAFVASTAMLRSAEDRHDMPIRVSGFILEHHRQSRLFLISDHPSLSLYLHVLRQLLALIGIVDDGLVCERTARSAQEPQWRWRTPILPRVARRLALRFADMDWIDDEIVPGRTLDLRSYLLLYYHRGSVILGPIGDAETSLRSADGSERTVEPSIRLVADRLRDCTAPPRHGYRLLEELSGGAVPLERDLRFEIDDRQWRSAWG